MTIITLYESGSTDGYKDFGDGRFYLNESEATVASSKHGGYGRVITHKRIGVVGGKYYRLESVNPIAIANSPEDKANIRKAALSKLSNAEKEVLGLTD